MIIKVGWSLLYSLLYYFVNTLEVFHNNFKYLSSLAIEFYSLNSLVNNIVNMGWQDMEKIDGYIKILQWNTLVPRAEMASGCSSETHLFVPQDRNYSVCLNPNWTNPTLRSHRLPYPHCWQKPLPQRVHTSRFLDVHQDQIESLGPHPSPSRRMFMLSSSHLALKIKASWWTS